MPTALWSVPGPNALLAGFELVEGGASAPSALLRCSPRVIGLTVVASACSTPELTDFPEAEHLGREVLVPGDLVLSSEGIAVLPGAPWLDLPLMLAEAVDCLSIFTIGHWLAQCQGEQSLAFDASSTMAPFLAATGVGWPSTFQAVMMAVVAPLTVITLAILAVREP
jgi:cation:H+ antiporter